MKKSLFMRSDRARRLAVVYSALCGLVGVAFVFSLMFAMGRDDGLSETERMTWAILIALPIWNFGYFWPLIGPLMQRLGMGWLRYWAILNLALNVLVTGSVAWHASSNLDWGLAAASTAMMMGAVAALWLSQTTSNEDNLLRSGARKPAESPA